jgi:hypothetical protein
MQPKVPDVLLKCDGPGCIAIPDKAPRIYCPAKGEHRYVPVTLAFPQISYCEACWNKHMKLDELLTTEVKTRIEERAKKIWPHGVVPDFDAALVEPISVYTPEYAQYMERLGFRTDGLGFSLHQPVVHPRMPR